MKKGDLIRVTRRNPAKEFKNTIANITVVYEITRCNAKTYSVKCVEGSFKGSGCYILKDAIGKSYKDIYGTTTTYKAENRRTK